MDSSNHKFLRSLWQSINQTWIYASGPQSVMWNADDLHIHRFIFLDAQLDTPWVNNQVFFLKISPPCIASCIIKDVLFGRLRRKPVPTPGVKLDPEHKLLGQGNHGTAWISCSFLRQGSLSTGNHPGLPATQFSFLKPYFCVHSSWKPWKSKYPTAEVILQPGWFKRNPQLRGAESVLCLIHISIESSEPSSYTEDLSQLRLTLAFSPLVFSTVPQLLHLLTSAVLLCGEESSDKTSAIPNPHSSPASDTSPCLGTSAAPVKAGLTCLHPSLGRSQLLWCEILTK